jgi:hypothetical protein
MDCEYASIAIRISEHITVSQISGAKAEKGRKTGTGADAGAAGRETPGHANFATTMKLYGGLTAATLETAALIVA